MDTEAKMIGKKIRHLRVDNEISQEELSKIINCKRACISNWEIGASYVPTKYIIKMAKIFNISMEYFYPYER